MNKFAGLSNLKEVFFIFMSLFFCLSILISADVISTNPAGSQEHAMTPERYIEGFFFGAPEVSQENNAPVLLNVILNSTSGNNLTSDDLTCYATITDAEADTMNVSVRWYKNGGLNLTVDYNEDYANATNFYSVLLSGNTTKGEKWMCSLRGYDGTVWGEWANSSNLTIENTAPTVSLYAPEDGNITTNRTPAFYWNGSDADEDLLTYTLNLTVGGSCACSDSRTDIDSGNNQYYVIQEYLLCLKDNGCYYNWTARAYDGLLYSEWASPRKIEIQASLAVDFLLNDTVNFGNISMDATNDTTTNNPYPFSLENNGNCFANVSINATALWQSVTTESDTYKFKADNFSGEEGAFNWAQSQTSWAQMPITGQSIAIAAFNFSDSKDAAEVDLLVTVPSQEPAGDRGSLVYFESSLGE